MIIFSLCYQLCSNKAYSISIILTLNACILSLTFSEACIETKCVSDLLHCRQHRAAGRHALVVHPTLKSAWRKIYSIRIKRTKVTAYQTRKTFYTLILKLVLKQIILQKCHQPQLSCLGDKPTTHCHQSLVKLLLKHPPLICQDLQLLEKKK